MEKKQVGSNALVHSRGAAALKILRVHGIHKTFQNTQAGGDS